MTELFLKSSNLENLIAGKLSARWNANGTRILRYYIDLRHSKMNLHRELSAPEVFILQSKVDALLSGWDEKWEQHKLKLSLQSGKDAADSMTAAAIHKLDSLSKILTHTLTVNDAVDWESLKDRSTYPMPKRFSVPKPVYTASIEPQYVEPEVSFWNRLMGKKAQIIEAAVQAHREAVMQWTNLENEAKDRHKIAAANWQKSHDQFWSEHKAKEAEFLAEQTAQNSKVDALRMSVSAGDPEAVLEHASMVLEASDYDGLFEKSYEIQYRQDDRLLMVAYDLPSPETLPSVKNVKFVKATGELKETLISDRDRKSNFESATYQICLRTLHELFEADVDHNFNRILFNGNVEFIDPRTGQESRVCLLSVLVEREPFQAVDLARVDPKACFKSFKGVSAASLASLSPIPPVMEMDREDKRFIDAREVSSNIDEGTNLASMSWEDFEHLVRELFEQEFRSRGGEVKVTRSSSDGGVDAVAFDPDPISGGKIVIQAKRYTRTVGLAAVRDLYGTVMNEGASKGILVTTADYGPDAYQFANGKPLTLLNGANLLHLMAKHGQKARIDIQEARSQMV